MLAGLLFAIHDAEDRPDRLAAALPFAGTTLIEYQARLLAEAGASQIVVVVAKLTPDLLGAISRIGRRGLAVDAVRSAAEAAEKLHPLARVLVIADGLVTTGPVVRQLASEGGDALLVVGEEEAAGAYERIGGRMAWAGVARLAPARIREVAAMPRDYDLQSALLRAAAQARAAHLLLPPQARADGHGIEHRAAALAQRSRAVLAAAMSGAERWFERWVVAPLGRLALPALVGRGVPTGVAMLGGAALGGAGLAALWFEQPTLGLSLALLGAIGLALGSVLAGVREERGLARGQALAVAILPGAAALLLGQRLAVASADRTALVTAIGIVTLAGLAERAAEGRPRALLWGSPGAYLLLLAACTALGAPLVGLGAGAVYAAGTLFAAIEGLRRQA